MVTLLLQAVLKRLRNCVITRAVADENAAQVKPILSLQVKVYIFQKITGKHPFAGQKQGMNSRCYSFPVFILVVKWL